MGQGLGPIFVKKADNLLTVARRTALIVWPTSNTAHARAVADPSDSLQCRLRIIPFIGGKRAIGDDTCGAVSLGNDLAPQN
jgi:hypothetical protein